MRIRFVVMLATSAVLAACSAPTTSGSSGASAPGGTSEVAPVTTSAAPAATSAAPAEESVAAPETCTVPDVVGMVHQTAQDTMQAAGLYVLMEKDATGQGRVLVLDRNWTTTAQSVPAGKVVDCTTEIVLSAKKIGE